MQPQLPRNGSVPCTGKQGDHIDRPDAVEPALALSRTQTDPLAVLSELPDGLLHVLPTWDRFQGEWWKEYSTALLPHDVPVCLEWTPEALFQYIPEVATGYHVYIIVDKQRVVAMCDDY